LIKNRIEYFIWFNSKSFIGYTIDNNELIKIKRIIIRERKGEAISKNEAKFYLKFAKRISRLL